MFVNATTGNLVISRQDEFLVGRGPDASVSRTYNSLATLDDDNNDRWRQSTDRRVFGLTGTLNTANSTVRRVSGDGTEIVYTWDAAWRNGTGAYVAKDGGGAYDTIVKSGTEWIWSDGDSQVSEKYYDDSAAVGLRGRIKSQANTFGYLLTFGYDASARLSTVTTSDGSWLRYDYADTTSQNITQVVTGYTDLGTSTAATLTRTRYGYDGSNRLTTVTVDLTPGDGSVSDGASYVTTYGYDASGRVSSIAQSDGSLVTVGYESSASTARVTSLVETAASGVTRTTGFAYAASTTYTGGTLTTITDPSGQQTKMETDASGNLRKITAPAAYAGAAQQVVQFTYNANGDVTSVIDAANKTTSYGDFTVDGLARTVTDTLGNVVTRTFGSIDRTTAAVTVYADASAQVATSDTAYITNVVLSETRQGVDQTGAAVSQTTRYVYDKYGNLRYSISPEGRVAEQTWANGVVSSEIEYPEALYTTAGTPDETAVNDWRDGLPDRSWIIKKLYEYDARQNLKVDRTFGSSTATGGWSSAEGAAYTNYVYDQAGQLLSTWPDTNNATSYTYDGMGRVRTVSDVNGGTTTYVYNDAATTTTITYASGYVVTRTWNKAGDLLSETDSGTNTVGGTTSYAYDTLGRVRVRTDAVNSTKTYYVYDNAGRKVAEVSDAGLMTEYRYDAVNRLVGTIIYKNAVSAANLTTLADPGAAVTVTGIRPTRTLAQDITSWTIYDSEGRVVQTIAGDGSVTSMTYDAAGRLQKTTAFANRLSSAVMNGFFSSPPTAVNFLQNAAFDGGTQYWSQTGTANATAVTSPTIITDSQGNKLTTTFRSSTTTDAFSLYVDSAGFSSVLPGQRLAVSEQVTVSSGIGKLDFKVEFRDQSGQFISAVTVASVTSFGSGTVTVSGFVGVPAGATQMRLVTAAYSGAAAVNTDQTVTIAKPMVSVASATQTVQPAYSATPTADAAKDTVARNFYDEDGLLVGTLDGEGYLVRNEYDKAGRLIAKTAFATATNALNRASGSWNTLLTDVGTSAQDRTSRLVYDGQSLLRYSIDPLGQVTAYTYAANTRLLVRTAVYDAPIGATSDYTYDNVKALLTTQEAATAKRASYNLYDAAGRLAYSVDAAGGIAGYTYDSSGRVTKSVRYATAFNSVPTSSANMTTWLSTRLTTSDRTSRVWYTERGEVAYTVDAEGFASRNFYDADGRVTGTTVWNDRVTVDDTTTLAALAALLPAATSANSVTTYRDYDALGRVIRDTDGMGAQTTYAYLGATSLMTTRIVADNGTAIEEATDTWTYDASGKVTQSVAAAGATTNGGVAATTTTTYNGKGQVLGTSFDNSGSVRTTAWEYDLAGRVKKVTDAEGGITSYEYNAFGEVWKVTDANLSATYTWYDNAGRATTTRDAGNYITKTAYNVFGDVASVTRYSGTVSGTASLGGEPAGPGTGAVTSFAYDKMGRVLSTTDANGNAASSSSYTGTGNYTETYTESYTYTAFGERKSVTNRLGGVTNYVYDRVGNLVREGVAIATTNYKVQSGTFVTGAETGKTYSYDARGNRIGMAEGYATTVGGTLVELRTTSWKYDAADRVTVVLHDNESVLGDDFVTATTVTPVEKYTYDARGNVILTISGGSADSGATVSTEAVKTYAYYDDLGRKTAEIRQVEAGKWIYSAHTYDKAGNRLNTKVYETALTTEPVLGGAAPAVPAGTWRETAFTYDKLGRLLTTNVVSVATNTITSGSWNGSAYVSATGNLTSTYQYDADGNVVKATDPNGNVTWNWYDSLNRKVAQLDSGSYLTTWSYDAEGNVAQETRFATKFTGSPSLTVIPTVAANAQADRTTVFTYDLNGNRLSEKRLGVAAWAVDANGIMSAATLDYSLIRYTYNALGQVVLKEVGVAEGSAATGGIASYVYDKTGRLQTEKRASFTDHTGAVVTPSTGYAYDALGNLTKTTVAAGTTPSATLDRITEYYYDDTGGRLLSMKDANGVTHSYSYDVAGRLKKDAYTRNTTSGSVMEFKGTTYDLAGRVLSQSVWSGGSRVSLTANKYNSFDQVIEQGQGTNAATGMASGTALYQVKNKYDGAGRLVATNSGDGVWKFFGYDRNGNQTAAVTSAGYALTESMTFAEAQGLTTDATNGAKVNGTYTVYDTRGMALSSVEEGREAVTAATVETTQDVIAQTITTSRTYNAFGEVLSETDARGNTTDYAYNTMGRLLSRQSPLVDTTAENGLKTQARPTEYYYYDLGGRFIGKRDANSNLNTLVLLDGTGYDDDEALVLKERHADNGIVTNGFDIFGDKRKVTNEVGKVEQFTYDKLGRLTQQVHETRTGVGTLTDNYTYDIFGQRLTHWNSQLGSTVLDKTDYDALGRVTSMVDMGGNATTYSYAWNGTTTTTLGTATITSGAWTKTTVNAAGRTMTEVTDVYGRALDKVDYGAHDYAFTYDAAGRLSQRTNNAGETIAYSWYNTGLQAQIVSGFTTTYYGSTATSSFKYDVAGNRVFEGHVVSGTNTYWTGYGMGSTYSYSTTHQQAKVKWDALGRMTSFVDANPSGSSSPVNIQWEYDLAGNIRRMASVFRYMDVQGTLATSDTTQEYWYRYDSMNRFVTTKGMLSGTNSAGTTVIGDAARGLADASIKRFVGIAYAPLHTEGMDIAYDLTGRRQSVTRTNIKYLASQFFTARYLTDQREDYSYSDDGYLASVAVGEGTLNAQAAPATGITRSTYARDLMGRVTAYREYNDTGYNGTSPSTNLVYERLATYNATTQRLTNETVTSVRADGTWVNTTTYAYGANETSTGSGEWQGTTTGGTYMGGAVTVATTSVTKNGTAQTGNTTTNSYVFWDGALQSRTNYVSGSTNNNSYFYYDTSGHLTSVNIQDGRPRSISFINDAYGQILQRDENDNQSGGDPRELHFYFNGLRVGDISNNGTSDVDYVSSIAAHTAASGTGAFRNGATTGVNYADFDQSYDPINGLNYQSTSSRYTVQAGDTLESISLAVWGDASFWYMIADANGLSASDSLVEGMNITIPNKLHNAHNNSSTYKVYDPNEAIGDTSPTAAKPPKKNKCGVFGQILLAAIAIAVTVIALPTGASPTILQGALAGLAGGAASQAVGLVTGIQDKINFKGLALAAIGGGVSAGVAQVLNTGAIAGSQILGDVVRGAVGSAVTQGIGVATGLQDKFSWAGVAAAGVMAGIGGVVAREFQKGHYSKTGTETRTDGTTYEVGKGSWVPDQGATVSFGGEVLSGTASLLAGAATRSAIEGSNFGDNITAMLPDALGQVIGRAGGRAIDEADSGILGAIKDILESPVKLANTVGNLVADGVASMGRNAHAADILDQIAPNGATPQMRQHVKEMLAVGVSDSDIAAYYAQGLDKVGGGANGSGGSGNSGIAAARPFVVGSDPQAVAIATGPTATQSLAYSDAIQSSWHDYVFGPGQSASTADFVAQASSLTGDNFVADDGWDRFRQAVQSNGKMPFDPTLRHDVQVDVSLASQLDGQLMTSSVGAFLWGELNTGSFGVAGAFDSTGLVQASADSHPYAQYAGVGAGILIGSVGSFGKLGAAERGTARFTSQGFSPAQAEYLASPYEGMGHHFIPRRAGLPTAISDSPLNVLKPNGISRGEFYELHYKVDPYFYGTRLPNSVGGTWSGRSLGLEKYGSLGRAWYGAPTPLKVTVGGAVAAGAGGAYYYLGDGK